MTLKTHYNFLRFGLILFLPLASGCIMGRPVVVTGIESMYGNKGDLLNISGTVASHRIFGTFEIDNPLQFDKEYKASDSAAVLIFKSEKDLDGNERKMCIIREEDDKVVYDFIGYGAPKKSKVFGINLGFVK